MPLDILALRVPLEDGNVTHDELVISFECTLGFDGRPNCNRATNERS
jgi:hypothetical protein